MDDATVHPDWSGLPEDLTAMVMRVLDISDLLRAGAVCASWRAAAADLRRTRFPITDSSPCLLYSCAADDPATATVYSPAAGAAFKVRIPPPAFRTRHVVGSGHGWVVTADEASNLQALNPLTGAQIDLPPVTGLHHIESSTDEQGRHVYTIHDKVYPDTPGIYAPRELRMYLYYRVCLSCSPSAGRDCIVLLMHKHYGEMSYARLGDGRWTLVTKNETVPWDFGFRTAAYNEKDGLFYVVTLEPSFYALDLNGPSSPTARRITQRLELLDDPYSCIAFASSGDILHISRYILGRTLTDPVQIPQEHAQEVIDPCQESYTDEMELYKVDIDGEKLVKMSGSDLQGHAVFLGFNSPMMLSTKDFPRLKPNCAYLTDDNWEQICINMYGCRDIGIWNFETYVLESLADLHSVPPWLNWPPPIWITPYLS